MVDLTGTIPFLIMISFCLFVGTPTNLLILKFYPFKGKTSTLDNFFIRVLAIIDTFVCGLLTLVTIVLGLNILQFTIFCKIARSWFIFN